MSNPSNKMEGHGAEGTGNAVCEAAMEDVGSRWNRLCCAWENAGPETAQPESRRTMDRILEKDGLKHAAAYMLTQLSEEAHDNARAHGFYREDDELIDMLLALDQPKEFAYARRNFVLAQLAMIASEVGEAVHAIQHGADDALGEELADVGIRLLDLAGFLRLDLGREIIEKMEANKSRPYKHGKVC